MRPGELNEFVKQSSVKRTAKDFLKAFRNQPKFTVKNKLTPLEKLTPGPFNYVGKPKDPRRPGKKTMWPRSQEKP